MLRLPGRHIMHFFFQMKPLGNRHVKWFDCDQSKMEKLRWKLSISDTRTMLLRILNASHDSAPHVLTCPCCARCSSSHWRQKSKQSILNLFILVGGGQVTIHEQGLMTPDSEKPLKKREQGNAQKCALRCGLGCSPAGKVFS